MQTDELISYIEGGSLDQELARLYGEGGVVTQRGRYADAVRKFVSLFGPADAHLFSAPGRTEVGGNHTDHQHGMVLAASIDLDTVAVVAASDEPAVDLVSEGYEPMHVSLEGLAPDPALFGTTQALIAGVVAGLRERGLATGGFRAYATSDVPGGAGLSSSAAFEALVGEIEGGLYNGGSLDEVDNAKIGQFAENAYFGKPCGLMDQMACAVGGFVHIDFKDPKAPVVEPIALDMAAQGYSLCIVDTKGSHADLTPDYAAIPAEMRRVAALFGKEVLRQVDKGEFVADLPRARQEVGDRAALRALHFFNEEDRVLGEAQALKTGDFSRFLSLVKASGDSSYKLLQNVYSPSDPACQAVAVGLAVSEDVLAGHGVCRVHGGGFAGTMQAFVETGFVDNYRRELDRVFGQGACHVLSIRPVGATQVL